MRNFKDLEVWKEGRVLTKDIYLLVKTLPEDEKYGLVSQIKKMRDFYSVKYSRRFCEKLSKRFRTVSTNQFGILF